jgi:hypothetical protein
MMFRACQAIGVTIAAAVLSTAVSACEGSAQPAAGTSIARSAAGSLKGLTSYQIISKAFANTEAALNVKITGKVSRSGQSTRLSSLSLVNGGSACIGDIYQSGIGTFQLIDDGTTAWILPSLDYWKAAGASHAAAVPVLEGKYLQLKPGGRGLGTLVDLCSLKALVGTGPSPARKTGIGAPTAMVVNGLPELKMLDRADGGYLTVTDSTTPRIVSFFVPGANGGGFSLSYSATAVTPAAPLSSEVVDGTPYGL